MLELKNKTIRHVLLGHAEFDGEWVKFITDEGTLVYESDANCCSDTFISNIQGLRNLLGYKVFDAVECPTINNAEPSYRQKYDDIHRYVLATDQGYVDIEFRNSSNGYYGGDFHLISREPSTIEWKELTDDYACNT